MKRSCQIMPVAGAIALGALIFPMGLTASAQEPDRIRATALGKSPDRAREAGPLAGVTALVAVAYRGMDAAAQAALAAVESATIGNASAAANWLSTGASVHQLGVEIRTPTTSCEIRQIRVPLNFEMTEFAWSSDIAEASGDAAPMQTNSRRSDLVPLFF